MKWSKPHYVINRFGFEVTMYIYQKPNRQLTIPQVNNVTNSQNNLPISRNSIFAKYLSRVAFGICTLFTMSAMAFFEFNPYAAYHLHGFDQTNNANSSIGTSINKSNVHKLKMKWVYNLDAIPVGSVSPPNPADNYRHNNYPVSGVATDLLGHVYVHLGDGRTLMIQSNKIVGTNPDGTRIPKLVKSLDLFSDPKYQGPPEGVPADPDNPERYDVYSTRMHPSIDLYSLYAGNWGNDGSVGALGWADKITGASNPTNPNYRNKGGAILYKINRFTGELIWKTVVDDDPRSAISAGSVSTPSLLHPLIFVPFGSIITGHLLNFNLFNADFSSGTPVLTDQIADVYLNQDFHNRGGLAAINKYTGQVVWKVYTLPKQNKISIEEVISHGSRNQWTGASSWGAGNPAISQKNDLVYFGVGEAASSTDAAETCEINRLTDPNQPLTSEACLDFNQDGTRITGPLSNTIIESSDNGTIVRSPTHPLPTSVIAVEMSTGKIKWAQRINGLDAWNAACFEIALGPDFSFINFPPIVPGTPILGVVGFSFPDFNRLPSGFVPGSVAGPNEKPLCPLSVRDDNLKLQAGGVIPADYRGVLFTSKDLDVAEQPMIVENLRMANGVKRDILLVTSKNATVYAFDAVKGTPLWSQKFGSGDLFGDGFVWGSATDGKRFYSNTGRSSGITLADLSDIDLNNPSLSLTNKVVIDSCPLNGFDAGGNWTGGSYVSVDLASGKVAWQRCVTGKVLDPDSRLPTGEIRAGRSQAGVSVANGLMLAPGASSYTIGPLTADNPLAEVLVLDTSNGALLRTLPLQLDGQPSANSVTYQRPIAIGDRVYITNGSRRADGTDDVSDLRNRVLMYELDD